MTQIIIYRYIYLHENLDYSQKYFFFFSHDYKFWNFLTIKDVHNHN
jgi:hypothetical protein